MEIQQVCSSWFRLKLPEIFDFCLYEILAWHFACWSIVENRYYVKNSHWKSIQDCGGIFAQGPTPTLLRYATANNNKTVVVKSLEHIRPNWMSVKCSQFTWLIRLIASLQLLNVSIIEKNIKNVNNNLFHRRKIKMFCIRNYDSWLLFI